MSMQPIELIHMHGEQPIDLIDMQMSEQIDRLHAREGTLIKVHAQIHLVQELTVGLLIALGPDPIQLPAFLVELGLHAVQLDACLVEIELDPVQLDACLVELGPHTIQLDACVIALSVGLLAPGLLGSYGGEEK